MYEQDGDFFVFCLLQFSLWVRWEPQQREEYQNLLRLFIISTKKSLASCIAAVPKL